MTCDGMREKSTATGWAALAWKVLMTCSRRRRTSRRGLVRGIEVQRGQAEVDDGLGALQRFHGLFPDYSAAWNWAVSVDSFMAVVEDWPLEMTVATWSK